MLYNIDPKIWGKHFWKILYCVAFAYPENPTEQDKENVKKFYMSIKNVLPCDKCRNNFEIHLKKYQFNDDVLLSRSNLINWIVNMNNDVNNMLGKNRITIEQAYNEFYNENKNSYLNKKIITVSLLVLLVFILICYIKFRD